MHSTARITLQWTAHAPPIVDEVGAVSDEVDHSPPLPTHNDAEIFLVSECAIRVPVASLCARSSDTGDTASTTTDGTVPVNTTLHALLWPTARHCLETVDIEVDEDAMADGRPRLLRVPASCYTMVPFHGLIKHPEAPAPASTSPSPTVSPTAEEAGLMEGEAAHVPPLTDLATAERERSADTHHNHLLSMSLPAFPSSTVADPEVTMPASDGLPDVLSLSALASAGADGSGADALVLTLDFGEDSMDGEPHAALSEEARQDGDRVIKTETGQPLDEKGPVAATAVGVKRDRDDTDDAQPDHASLLMPRRAVKLEEPAQNEPETDASAVLAHPSTLGAPVPDAQASRRRLRLFVGALSPPPPPTAVVEDAGLCAKPEPLRDHGVKGESDEEADGGEPPTPAVIVPPRTLCLRAGVGTSAAADPAAPTSRRVRLVVSDTAAPVTAAEHALPEHDEVHGAEGEKEGSLTVDFDDADDTPDGTEGPLGEPAETPFLLSITPVTEDSLAASSDEGVSVAEKNPSEASLFFAEANWPTRVRAVVLHFVSPETLPSLAAQRLWRSQELTRLVCRPRTAPYLTRTELRDGPSQRHFYALSHPRFSAALCPHVSALLSLVHTEATEAAEAVKVEEEKMKLESPLSCQANCDTALVRGPPAEPVLHDAIAVSTVPLVLTTDSCDGGETVSAAASALPTTVTSRTRTKLTLLGQLPLVASQLCFLLRLHTVVTRTTPALAEATRHASPLPPPRLAPAGLATGVPLPLAESTGFVVSDAPTRSGGGVGLDSLPGHVHTATWRGLDWSVCEHLDGNTWEFTPPPMPVSHTSAPAAAARANEHTRTRTRYVVCDPSMEPLKIAQHWLAPLHYLLQHIQAWWAGQEAPGQAHSPVARDFLVLICPTTNWALDTQRGVLATSGGIALSTAVIEAAVDAAPLWRARRVSHRQPRLMRASALSALSAVASAVAEYHLCASHLSEPETPATVTIAAKAQAHAYGYAFTLAHLPSPVQAHTRLVSEAMPLTAPVPGVRLSPHQRDGLVAVEVPAWNTSAYRALERDRHRLAQWCEMLSRRQAGGRGVVGASPGSFKNTSSPRLPEALAQAMAASPWRAPFVADYFARTAASLARLEASGPAVPQSRPLRVVHLNTITAREVPHLWAPVVSVPVRATVRSFDALTQEELAPTSGPAVHVPLMGLLFVIERRGDGADSLEALTDALSSSGLCSSSSSSLSPSPSAQTGPLPFRLRLRDAAPVTWPLRHTTTTTTTTALEGPTASPWIEQSVVMRNRGADDVSGDGTDRLVLGDVTTATKGSSSAKAKSAARSAKRPAGQSRDLKIGVEEAESDPDGEDDDEDEKNSTDAPEEAGRTASQTWTAVALIPFVSVATSSLLRTDPTVLCVSASSLCSAVEHALVVQATRYVASLVTAQDGPDSAQGHVKRSKAEKKRHKISRAARAAEAAAAQTERDATVDRLAAPLAVLWGRLVVGHLIGHALLSARFPALLTRLKDEVEARLECLPPHAAVALAEASGSTTEDVVSSGLLLLDEGVTDAYTHVVHTIAAHRGSASSSLLVAAPDLEQREATLRAAPRLGDALRALLLHPARLRAAAEAAADELLTATYVDVLRAETARVLPLTNVSWARWRARFHVKAELKHAPPPHPAVEADLSPLTALAHRHRGLANLTKARWSADRLDGEEQEDETDDEVTTQTWAHILDTHVLLF